ncbi:MAG: sugar ABC transporter ATP-binding protein [Microbacterium sp.]|uniref:sugar ABC transporter ATP-binding protein n=1 Tax=Microbacterium sp. TaxID=51671 RepID=UPI0039E354B4
MTILEFRNVAKSFPGVRALVDVSFTVAAGEVCTIAGENGAGKSTLLAILGGALGPDAGEIIIEGARRGEHTPRRALAEGVIIAHQEPAVVPQLTVEQNLLIGKRGADRAAARERLPRTYADLQEMGFDILPDRPMGRLSPAERHAVTIARALNADARIVALDEPTTSMIDQNVQGVLRLIRRAAAERGVALLYVSHKMPEVMAVSDSVVVLRDGRVSYRSEIAATSQSEIVRQMVGRELLTFRREQHHEKLGDVVLSVADAVHPAGVGPAELEVRAGEVLGVSGLVGSGRTELLRAIVRADRGASSRVRLRGKPVRIHGPRDALRRGIALIPEDRKKQGLVLIMSAAENIGLTTTLAQTTGGIVRPRRRREAARRVTERMSLRPSNVDLRARQFSGGNQQKLVIAKWLRRDADVYLFDEPTKGVDVGGKVEIYQLIDELATAGKAVVVVSSDLPELIALSGRVLVMRHGRIVAEHTGDRINEQALVASAMGIAEEEVMS